MTTRAVRLRWVAPGQADDKENTMSIGKVVAVVCVVGAVVFATLVVGIVQLQNNFVDECRKAGGVPFQPRDAHICLNPDAVIKLK